MLSSRGSNNAQLHKIPWRYALPHKYNKETNPEGMISFALAEHAPVRAEIVNYINTKVEFDVASVAYSSGNNAIHRLQKAVAMHLNNLLVPITPIDPEEVIVASGATAIGSMLGFTLAEPGDGLLISRPAYGRFELDYGVEAGVQMVYADTTAEEAFAPSVVEKYELALRDAQAKGVQIRALMLVNPHNPIGRCYSVETLTEILKFCNKHQLHLISDEIYASCVFDSGDPDAVPFTSILSLSTPELINPDLVHLLYGFSKDFASGGLHLGFLITKNKPLRHSCNAILRLHSASTAAVTIGTTILEDQDFVRDFTAKSQQSLASTYRIATSTLAQEGISYIKGGNAGFFIYIDLSSYLPKNSGNSTSPLEFTLAQKFVDAGVFLHPCEEHGNIPGWFRLVYAQDEDVLREGLRRMIGVLKSLV
ncbi:pyridoxal phosphate-dependent aminotransferase [Aspergillus vadensis CBS 113365]|uniref:Aspartate aminotransferase n=1 Tax=Aspergillus vadensis (strain CBS 113365 / IMI 142717 / IBT 24658) TaxID=1448311 RepID=A0A319BFA6_ASPVC|nr:aspartate aminotransferase [Aspergillus vadensis CBS 113365]PYH70714.1 aspartate aminotransferase [Aspergillus vadensis CBS 113365]